MKSESNFRAQKRFGQHFLTSNAIVKKMISFCDLQPEDDVLEIGPGPGILTKALLSSPLNNLKSIEIDRQFWPTLEALEADKRFHLLKKDALAVELKDCFQGQIKIIANLPYNIGSQLIINWLEEIDQIKLMVLMLQKEVVDRIIGIPRTKAYGRLTILIQSICDVERCFMVPPGNFSPPPKVDSAVILIRPAIGRNVNLKALAALTHLLFQNRRKMIGKALDRLNYGPGLDDQLEELKIQKTMRPEEVSVEQFVALSKFLENNLR